MIQDTRFALRILCRNPVFSAVAILTLAIGIGANTTIFSIVDGILFKPLPYAQPERLVMVWQDYTARTGRLREWWSWPNFSDVRDQSSTLDDLAVYTDQSRTLATPDGSVALQTATVSWNMLSLLGRAPVLGRAFIEEDGVSGTEAVAVVSHTFWRGRLGSNPDIVGSTLVLSGESVTVVGVMAPDFAFPFVPEPALWEPFQLPTEETSRGNVFLRAIGRRAPGATLAGARVELEALGSRLAEAFPAANAGTGIVAFPLLSELTGPVAPYLYILLIAVMLVLLIACANVANLLLARGTVRRTEVAVRSAMGASRNRLMRQLIVESGVMAGLGGILGVLMAVWGVDALRGLIAGTIPVPRLEQVGVDVRVLLFTFGATALTGLLFGIVPALLSTRTDLRSVLTAGGRGGDGARGGRRLRSGLVIAETAFSLVLLVGAALLLQSLVRLMAVDPGFRTRGITVFELFLPATRYGDQRDARRSLLADLEERLGVLPGVQGVGMSSSVPFVDYNTDLSFRIEGREEPPPDEVPSAWYRQINTQYFEVMGIPLLDGRGFGEEDRAGAEVVTVVNEAFRQRYFPDGGMIGAALLANGGELRLPIVGVVSDVRYFGLTADAPPALYLHAEQFPPMHMTFVVRTEGDPVALIPDARAVIDGLDSALAMVAPGSMEQMMRNSVTADRSAALLTGLFALAALILAAIGMYGVMSYQVTQRRQEIGIRMALGADATLVRRMVLRQGLLLAAAGTVIGLAAAVALMRLIEGLLFGVDPADPLTLAVAAVVMLAVGGLATWLPARHATRVDPVRALQV